METKEAPPDRRFYRVLALVLAAVVYTVLGLVYLRPILDVWQDRIAPGTGDSLFNLWVLKWGAHQIRSGFPGGWSGFWNANVYWPTPGTLALSDHLLGPALQLALFETVIPNAIAGYNALFFSSFVLTGLAVCWMVRRSGASWTAAVLAGAMYAYSPFRIGQLNHLQILLAQWIPPTLWFWDRLLAERTWRRAVPFLVFYLLNVSGGSYLAYMIHIPMLVMLVNRAAVHGRSLRRSLVNARSLRVLVPTGLIAATALAAVFLPYVRIGRELHLARSADEVGLYGATTLSWVSPARNALWFGPIAKSFMKRELGSVSKPFFRSENALSIGILPTILAAAGLWAAWRKHRPASSGSAPPLSPARRAALVLLLGAAAAAWIAGDAVTLFGEGKEKVPDWAIPAWAVLFGVGAAALGAWAWLRRRWGRGPVLRWREMDPWVRGLTLASLACLVLAHPIVYVPAMRILPGLDGMRVPARFSVFVSLAAVLFAARGLDLLLERLRRPGARVALVALASLILVVELAPRPVRWALLEREEAFPPVYAWLQAQPDVKALIELPIRPNNTEINYMYYSTLHWKPIANGYSGYRPASHQRITEAMRFLPDEAGLDLLQELRITHLVVHTKAVQGKGGKIRPWERQFLGRRLELVHTAGEARVYRLLSPA